MCREGNSQTNHNLTNFHCLQYSPTTLDSVPSLQTDLFDIQPHPNHKPMDLELYDAVKNGNVEHLDRNSNLFDNQVTPNHNTILHVAAHFGELKCVAKILERKPCLILRVNKNGENPLHIAIREQHLDTVRALLNGVRYLHQDLESCVQLQQILRARNEDGDTPLHLAVREGDNEFVSLLANQDLRFPHSPNKAEETPLYLAAEKKDGFPMVESILACNQPTYTGPNGRTALHAAAISGNPDSIRMLLAMDQNMELIDRADAQGWTPLHYAAYCNHKDVVGVLLAKNKSIGYTRTTGNHDNVIALHIAAAAADEYVAHTILSHCPDCWEMVNSKGQNILHIAVESKEKCIIDYIIKTDWLGSLINQKDIEGNTPLHLLASLGMDMDDVIKHPRANMYVVNNKKKTPAEVAMSIKQNNGSSWSRSSWYKKPCGWRNIDSWRNIGGSEENKAKMTADLMVAQRKEVEEKHKSAKTLMLVATLIATITFAAGFTIPGGYEVMKGSEVPEGKAVLMREAGFNVFAVFNTIAVMCSTSSVLVYGIATLYKDDLKKVKCYMMGFGLVLFAIIAMTVGFLSGTYAILVHSLGVKIATSVIGGTWFLLYLSGGGFFIIDFQGQ